MAKIRLDRLIAGGAEVAAGAMQGRQQAQADELQRLIQAGSLQAQQEQSTQADQDRAIGYHLQLLQNPNLDDQSYQDLYTRSMGLMQQRTQPSASPYADALWHLNGRKGPRPSQSAMQALPTPSATPGTMPGGALPSGMVAPLGPQSRRERDEVAADLARLREMARDPNTGDAETANQAEELRIGVLSGKIPPATARKQAQALDTQVRTSSGVGQSFRTAQQLLDRELSGNEHMTVAEGYTGQARDLQGALAEIGTPDTPEKRRTAQILLKRLAALRAKPDYLTQSQREVDAHSLAVSAAEERKRVNLLAEAEKWATAARQSSIAGDPKGFIDATRKLSDLAHANPGVAGLAPYNNGEFDFTPQKVRLPGASIGVTINGVAPKQEVTDTPQFRTQSQEERDAELATRAAEYHPQSPQMQRELLSHAASAWDKAFATNGTFWRQDAAGQNDTLRRYAAWAEKVGLPSVIPPGMDAKRLQQVSPEAALRLQQGNARLLGAQQARDETHRHALKLEEQAGAALRDKQGRSLEEKLDPSSRATLDRLKKELAALNARAAALAGNILPPPGAQEELFGTGKPGEAGYAPGKIKEASDRLEGFIEKLPGLMKESRARASTGKPGAATPPSGKNYGFTDAKAIQLLDRAATRGMDTAAVGAKLRAEGYH